MHPNVRRDLTLLGKFDHVNVAARRPPAETASSRCASAGSFGAALCGMADSELTGRPQCSHYVLIKSTVKSAPISAVAAANRFSIFGVTG
jgi:hypothetical protein